MMQITSEICFTYSYLLKQQTLIGLKSNGHLCDFDGNF